MYIKLIEKLKKSLFDSLWTKCTTGQGQAPWSRWHCPGFESWHPANQCIFLGVYIYCLGTPTASWIWTRTCRRGSGRGTTLKTRSGSIRIRITGSAWRVRIRIRIRKAKNRQKLRQISAENRKKENFKDYILIEDLYHQIKIIKQILCFLANIAWNVFKLSDNFLSPGSGPVLRQMRVQDPDLKTLEQIPRLSDNLQYVCTNSS